VRRGGAEGVDLILSGIVFPHCNPRAA